MIDEDKIKKIVVYCPVDLFERVDRIAAKGGLTRSKLVLNMIGAMVDYFELCESFGLVDVILLIKGGGEKLKEWVRKTKGNLVVNLNA
jgi:hypothetical protein